MVCKLVTPPNPDPRSANHMKVDLSYSATLCRSVSNTGGLQLNCPLCLSFTSEVDVACVFEVREHAKFYN